MMGERDRLVDGQASDDARTIADPAGPGPSESGPSTVISGATLGPAPDPDAATIHDRGPDGPGSRPAPTVPGYEILGELGRGGMGVVYKARENRLNRPCALKMILAGAHADPVAAVRFLGEAEAVARLEHPNVIRIHRVGEASGLPFFELEYVEGGSLDRWLDGTPWAPPRAARLVEGLALGVAEAHRLGIVHRDLKPANILIAAGERPKITDFGLAKLLNIDGGLTRTESIMGSPSYMSPEQAGGHARGVGPASDVYSMGAILYELLTGRPPFRGATVLETLAQVASTEVVPPSRLVPGTPRDLETICLVCLRKEPTRRYASAGALGEDLRRFLAGESILARRSGPARRAWRWCRRNPSVAGLAASVVVLLVALAIGSSIAAFRLNRERLAVLAEQARAERSEDRRREGLADSVMTAVPDVVPFLVESLRPSRERALPLLRRPLSDPSPTRRLRAAIALALLGEPDRATLVESIPTALSNECRNIVAALAMAGGPAREALLRRAGAEVDPATRARFASVLLSLGEPLAARGALALGEDPAARVAFIHGFGAWHGDLSSLPGLIRRVDDPAFRSGLAAALGLIDRDDLDTGTRLALEGVFAELHRDDPDGATHSAAGWVLRRWGVEPPAIGLTPGPPGGHRWFVNRGGLTMLELAPGVFSMGDLEPTSKVGQQPVALTRRLFMSDREVSSDLFRRFADDADGADPDKPRGWPGPDAAISPTGDCPVNNVTLDEIILFCNWLSRREGRRPCYRRARPGVAAWTCDPEADGYRLPTGAEWEYACRAGTTTRYPMGDEPDLLTHYGQVLRLRTLPCGNRLPNAWGLFDMLGNVWELCWDTTRTPPGPLEIDPVGEARAPRRDMRGGALGAGGFYTRSGFRIGTDATGRDRTRGFRVVCGPSDPGAEGRNHAETWAGLAASREALPGGRGEAIALWTALGRWHEGHARPAEAAAARARAAALAVAGAKAPVDESRPYLEAECWVVGPYPDQLRTPYPPEAAPDPTRPVAGPDPPGGGGPGELSWKPLPVGPDGVVDLGGAFENAEHVGAYVLARIRSPDEREVILCLGSDDLARIWLDGRLVHEKARAEQPWGPDAFFVTVRLRPGRNTLLAKVVNGVGLFKLFVRVSEAPADRGRALIQQGRWGEAVEELTKALASQPDRPELLAARALGHSRRGRPAEAAADYARLSELRPDDAATFYNLGAALDSRAKLEEALGAFRRGAKLAIAGSPLASSLDGRVRRAERRVELASRLPGLLKGDSAPRDAAEGLDLAQLCSDMDRPAAAARFAAGSMEADPSLAEDRRSPHRYDAACWAALAGTGRGVDEPPPDEPERARLRLRALDWLKAELGSWSKALEAGVDEPRARAIRSLNHWTRDPDLAGVRDPEALTALPEAERDGWRTLWAEVDRLRGKGAP